MKILFAAPDRDLLECFRKLLETDLGETVTAFDGTQVLTLLASESVDAVILDSDLPRVDHRTLVSKIRGKNIPVVVLTDGPVTAAMLTGEPTANEYLSYPFNANKLSGVIKNVLETASSCETFRAGAGGPVITRSRIENGPGLTAGEIRVLRSLANGETVSSDDGAYITSLNAKFAACGSKTRIRYRAKKGFETVTEDE